ncbi:hypothetical protein DAPPUDRAFT_233754 [Daphnia pulex]|uniref:Uncharacterized protein n=1 Tax=Daphnia pulex TaxID=6669 RepID=E9FVM3_DAPPU|nr:hypothetical protein DAPPUDRAFT_233754 [Daphnia pulex]|eukprot:EFX89079.1 hypothetical protein DAPPUDRAFT_233754 [Daphnia pulex]
MEDISVLKQRLGSLLAITALLGGGHTSAASPDRIQSMGNEEVAVEISGKWETPNDVGGGGVDISYAIRNAERAHISPRGKGEEIKKRTLTLAGSQQQQQQLDDNNGMAFDSPNRQRGVKELVNQNKESKVPSEKELDRRGGEKDTEKQEEGKS